MTATANSPGAQMDKVRELHERLMTNKHSGVEPVGPTREFAASAAKLLGLPAFESLLEWDLDTDFAELEETFLKDVKKKLPPSNVRCIMMWVVGSGPEYPLHITGQDSFPEPVVDTWLKDKDVPSKDVWDVKDWPHSAFLQHFDEVWQEACEEAPEGEDALENPDALNSEDYFELGEMIVTVYLLHFISHMASKHRNLLLGDADRRYVVYGFDSGDCRIAGRISKDAGWEPVEKLLDNSSALSKEADA